MEYVCDVPYNCNMESVNDVPSICNLEYEMMYYAIVTWHIYVMFNTTATECVT